MAGAISPLIYSFINNNPTKQIRTSFSPSPSSNFSSKHQHPRIRYHPSRNGNPRITTCHGKLNGSTSEVFDEIDQVFFDGDDDDESDDDEETESSLDLLFRFLQSMFKKVSKRAKKASRSVLPVAMSPQLVSFAVDGVLLLASLSILKAFLEVICNLGGTVFVAILLLRVILATISYFQSNGYGFNRGGGSSFGTTQPAS